MSGLARLYRNISYLIFKLPGAISNIAGVAGGTGARRAKEKWAKAQARRQDFGLNLRQRLAAKALGNMNKAATAGSSRAALNFAFKNCPYYEPAN